ncbi:phage tail tape measure protein [Pectobacterium brasiliense]|uniref:Phage tail tape measure protein n=2 Tax=Pectobacterium brasiliense TaxID=180957 RepID=A0A3S1AK55_9GAMM|nr:MULTISPECIES: phage tail tape measure protein [Pectobacterium]GKW27992.1 phage tail tape measure protein [Pectobacterium carotovorum subsp. carotovorum]MBN3046724.1 phage tail tape measure protein [Pectobacterium brasiliense]MBN3075143.1 phage tail tape measure protein [Pectobacterium brasiliense]MBN3083731.1 phage tail tape measure protein [Pectobacterium brasiliense]MBN3089271.1 phage tail tape measure protein [Pectobacterium brasiliense]
MKQLDFTLSLIDKLTRPIKQAQTSVTGFAEKSQAAFKRMAIGGAGLFATGLAIRDALAPAIEMNDALLSASAQGVSDATLKQVAENGLKFSVQYGKSALEFVQSTEMINRSVGGLSDGELPRMTTITNTVAAALKSTAADTTEFMGQMFANFRSDAKTLGNLTFAEQVAGKAAYMRQAFGTEMATIRDLMEGSKGAGTNFGVGMDEQFAVLGELQRTLGSEASGSYESYLTGAADGAKKLGLTFTDTNGKLLSMPAMLEKLQSKYGASIEGNLKAQKELDDAFGGGSAVIKQLYGNVGVLQRHITELGSSDGMKRATEMAEKMANPWDRLVAVWYAMRAAMGATLLPVLYPLINKLADAGQTLVRWQTLFPNITRVIGYAVLAVLSLAAAGAIVNIIMGVSTFVMVGLKGLWMALTTVMKIHVGVIWLYNKAVLAWSATMRILRGVLLAVRMASMSAGIAFNFALWPVLLIIVAVAALAAGCYLLYQHWDQIVAAVMQTEAFKTLAAIVQWVGEIFASVWASVVEGWNSVVGFISNFSLMETMGNMVSGIGELFSGLWKALLSSFSSTYSWIVEKLNHIPGVNIDMPAKAAPPVSNGQEILTGGKIKGIERGGLNKEISNNNKSYTDNSKNFGNITINASKGMTPEQLQEWEELR